MKNLLLFVLSTIAFSCSQSENSKLDAGDNVKPIGDYSTTDGDSVFSLGNGFDELKRQVKPFMCLDSNGLMVQMNRLNFLESRSEIIKGKKELVERLDIKVNVGVSGVYSFFTGDVSTAVNFARQTNVSSDTIMVVVEYNYIDNKKMIYGRSPKFLDDVIYSSMDEFRQDCGDKYLSEIEVGARLYYVFTSQYQASSSKSKTEVESAIKAGFGKMFNINTNTKVTEEQEEIFNQTNISIHCLTQGIADPTVCSSRHEVTGDSDAMNKILGSLELAFTSAVRDHPDFIVVKQKFKDYPFSKIFETEDVKDHMSVMDIRLENTKTMVNVYDEVEDICGVINYNNDECNATKDVIRNIMDSCLEPSIYRENSCDKLIEESSITSLPSYQKIIADASPGQLSLYEHDSHRGLEIEMKLKDIYSNYSPYKANQYINLTESRFSFNDKVSSYEYKLRDGWQIRLFEHPNGEGRQIILKGKGMARKTNPFVWNWNDKFSSLILERYED